MIFRVYLKFIHTINNLYHSQKGFYKKKLLQHLFVVDDGLVVVKALRLEHLGKVALVTRRLLQLGALVLEPDLQLVLGEAELDTKVPPPLLGEISVA